MASQPSRKAGDAGPGHGHVVDQHRATDLLQRRQGHPARGEQQVRLGQVVGGVHEVGAGLLAQPGQGGDLLGRGRATGVGLGDQQGPGTGGEIHLEHGVDRADAGPVHDLEQAGHEPAGDHPLHDLPRLRRRPERGGQGDRLLRRGPQGQRRLGDDAERALGADEQAGQVVARDALDRAAAGAQHPPVGEDDLQAEHVVGGDAVLDAAEPAGVRGEVAADRAPVVAGGVRRIEQAGPGDGVPQRLVHDAGLDDGEAIGRRHLQDGVHPGHHQRDRAVDGVARAGQPRAGAARHDRDAVPGGHLHHRDDLGGAARQDDRRGGAGLGEHGLVTGVGRGHVGVEQDALGAERGLQLGRPPRRGRRHISHGSWRWAGLRRWSDLCQASSR